MASDLQHMPLNAIDHMPPPNYSNAILYLPLKSGASAKEAFKFLQHGLQATFDQMPWLAGKIYPVSPDTPNYRPGLLEVRYRQREHDDEPPPLHQFKFKELDTEITYDELRETGFHPEAFDDATLTWAKYIPDVTQGADIVVAQANSITGGLLITLATCHVACDGVGTINVTRMWSKNCRELQLNRGSQIRQALIVPEISDHSLLERKCAAQEGGHERPLEEYPPEAWRLLNLEPPSTITDEETPSAKSAVKSIAKEKLMKSYVLYISPANVTALREDCMKDLSTSTLDLSINDVICALIWRSLLKSRIAARAAPPSRSSASPETPDSNSSSPASPYNTTSINNAHAQPQARLDLPFDARPYLSHLTIPPDYMGNFTMINQALLPLSTLISPSTPLSTIALAIRSSACRITAPLLMQAYALLRQLFREGAPSMKLHRTLAVGGTGLMITSLVAFPLGEVCFEGDEDKGGGGGGGGEFFRNAGRPEAMRTLMGAVNQIFRYGAVMPRKGFGGVEFVVNAYEDEMEILMEDEELSRYAVFVA
ncbi:MAG: hypothetical protein Q9227_003087 [Pyrenula ochraceoflavens]